MLKERDNIHMSLRPLMGYNKPFNFVATPREPGKSTCLWCDLFYVPFKKEGKALVLMVDTANSVDEAMITSIEDKVREFCQEDFKFTFKASSVGKDSIFDLYAMRGGEKTRAIRFVSFNTPMQRIKQTAITNISYIAQDEFIKNPKYSEKYPKGQYQKLRDIYSTYVRGTPKLQFWAFGNPVSLYNPYFIGFNIKATEVEAVLKKQDCHHTIVGDIWAFHSWPLTEELRAFIIERNPLYKFDEEYKNFAVEGYNINDKNIPLGERQDNYSLYAVFKINNKNIAVYQDNTFMKKFSFFCDFISEIGARRTPFCFDFEEIVEGTILMSITDRQKFARFRDSLRKRSVYFSSIEVYYLIEEIYLQL